VTGGTTGVHAMAQAQPSLEAIAAQLRAFSRAKGGPVTEREWNAQPARLCGATTVRRRFGRPWNAVLRACGVTPRDTRDPAYVAHWVLAFYARPRRWPRRRDFTRPCSHWVVKHAFRDAANAVAAAVRLARGTLRGLTREGVTLTDYLARHFLTAPPQAPPAARAGPASAVRYGLPTGYAPFPYAPRCEVEVVALFMQLAAAGKLRPRFLVESIDPQRFPGCKAKQLTPGGEGCVDVWIAFGVRSSAYRRHGQAGREEPCDYLVCWEDDWPVAVPKPPPQILALRPLVGPGA
jgi:hypothetical protein